MDSLQEIIGNNMIASRFRTDSKHVAGYMELGDEPDYQDDWYNGCGFGAIDFDIDTGNIVDAGYIDVGTPAERLAKVKLSKSQSMEEYYANPNAILLADGNTLRVFGMYSCWDFCVE